MARFATLPGARSLRRLLLVWVLVPQVVLWLAGAVFTFNLATRYANEAIDASLLQSARALARQVKPVGNGLYIDFPRAAQDILEADPQDRLLYMVSTPPGQFILGNRNLPDPPLDRLQLGVPFLFDSHIAQEPVRIVALLLSYGDELGPMQTMLVQVARSSANREQVARRILEDTMLPLSALMLLMSLIVWAGVRAGLAPLNRLRNLVEGRNASDLAPIELDAAPEEVRALAHAINHLLARVERSVTAQKRFISDAAHQLRTPLAGLKTQTELALADATTADQRQRLQRVQECAVRSAHLVNQLLTLARADPESATRQAHVRLDLAALARDVTAELVPRALQARIDLGYGHPHEDSDGDDTPPVYVHAIPLLLREALSNVIDNALRYAGSGSQVTVRAYADAEPGSAPRATLVVEDTGPGLPDEAKPQVFERFVRFSPDTLGCGLGLAIVKEIVERHAGTVHLHDVHPHGLRVVMHLPRASARPSG
jgi:two-component system, OmpR family, sensor histidine kinase TctE